MNIPPSGLGFRSMGWRTKLEGSAEEGVSSAMDNAIDRSQLKVRRRGFRFAPFRPKHGMPLENAGLPMKTDLLVFERGLDRLALIMREMAYHHVAQGIVGGEPFLVCF